MTTATADPGTGLARTEEPTMTPFQVMERVITSGDLGAMKPEERVAFYWRTCESLGLNPLTRPFEFITLNNKLTMYARKDATDQLRKINAVSVTELSRERTDDLMTVTATGRDKTGRMDSATGVVWIKGMSGEALANALMKAETKAKRRLTLSLVGLGFLDESEVEGASIVDVDPETGEILDRPKPTTLLESVERQREAMAATNVTPAEAAPVADQVTEAAATDAGDGSEGLSNRSLSELLKANRIDPSFAAAEAKRLFPDAKAFGDLDDVQRLAVWRALKPA